MGLVADRVELARRAERDPEDVLLRAIDAEARERVVDPLSL
jgi:hypothetical protein